MTKVLCRMMVFALALALVVGSAAAQEKKGRKGKGGGGGRARAMGVVASVNENSITVKGKEGDTVFSVNENTQFSKQVPTTVDALGESQWVQISGEVSEDGSSVNAQNITVMPQPAKGKGGVRGKRIMGLLTVSGGAMSIQAGEQTLTVNAGEKMHVIATEEAALTDLQEGSRVMIMGKDVEGEKQATMVRIMPQRAGKGGGKKKRGGGDE